jgi:hypothetical protein
VPSTSPPTSSFLVYWSEYADKLVTNSVIANDAYGLYNADPSSEAAIRNSEAYPQMVFKQLDVRVEGRESSRIEGTCDEWLNHAHSKLPLIHSRRGGRVQYVEVASTSELWDYTGDNRIRCADPTNASAILETLASARRAYVDTIVQCDGHQWYLKSFAYNATAAAAGVSGGYSTPFAYSLCVDCYHPDTGAGPLSYDCSYAPYKYYLAPCDFTNVCRQSGANMTAYRETIGAAKLLTSVYAPYEPAPALLGVGMQGASGLTTINKDSIHFGARLSTRGSVYCLAAPLSSGGTVIDTPSSIAAIRHAGTGTSSTLAASATVRDSEQTWAQVAEGNRGYGWGVTTPRLKIHGLSPATAYSVHCMSESADGLQSSMATMSDPAYMFVFSTACCKDIEVSFLSARVRVASASNGGIAQQAEAVRVVVGTRPTDAITVSFSSVFYPDEPVTLSNQQTLTEYQEHPYLPSSLSFFGENYLNEDAYSAHPPFAYPLTRHLDFSGGDVQGRNTLIATISGPSAGEFEVNYKFGVAAGYRYANDSIRVVAADALLPGPRPLEVTFSADGSKTYFVFDTATDRGGEGSYVQCKGPFQVRNSRFLEYGTEVPTSRPTGAPPYVPSSEPTGEPTAPPSSQPTTVPSGQPTEQPTARPSAYPSASPTSPTAQPTRPLDGGSHYPTGHPTAQPSVQPSGQPSNHPTEADRPTGQPSAQPTTVPSAQPSVQPTGAPSGQPSTAPTQSPNTDTAVPSHVPTAQPSGEPTSVPTASPSLFQPPEFYMSDVYVCSSTSYLICSSLVLLVMPLSLSQALLLLACIP